MRRSVIYAAPIILFLGLLGIFFSRIDADPGEVPLFCSTPPYHPFNLLASQIGIRLVLR